MPRSDASGAPLPQIAELDLKTKKIAYLTDGDGNQHTPRPSPKGDRIALPTTSNNFAGKHKPRVELDLAKQKRPAEVIAQLR